MSTAMILGTRSETKIDWIYTDPRVSVSSAPSVFYRNHTIIDDDKKPQMKADECRFAAINHRKAREERKAQLHKSLYSEKIIRTGTRITRITRIRTDLRVHPCDLCYILFKDSEAINTELVRTETKSGYSTFGG